MTLACHRQAFVGGVHKHLLEPDARTRHEFPGLTQRVFGQSSVRGGMTDSTHPYLLTRGSPPAGYPVNDVGECPRPHLAPTLTHEAQMIPFLTAVNITDGTADFDAEGAAFVNGLTSRTFRGRACVSKQEQNHIQYKAPSAHFWAEGQI